MRWQALLILAACSHAAPPPATPLPSEPETDPACSAAACLEAGTRALDAQDPKRAFRLFTKACDAGPAYCGPLASLYRAGVGVDVDLAKALALYQRGCEAGDGRSCSDLGVGYDMGMMVEQDHARANQLYEKACLIGYAAACTNLGFNYARGVGADADVAHAAVLYQHGCDAGDLRGCTKLAAAYMQGAGVDKLDTEAIAHGTRACDGGYMEGCVVLGYIYQTMHGDAAKAAPLYEKGCTGGESAGCINLAVLYRDGTGVPQNGDKVLELLARACQLGARDVCLQ